MNYNPYDLVPLLINGKAISGRPFEFDSVVTDQKEMRNSFGSYVKPTKLSTVCPDCGAGLQVDVVLSEPPFEPVSLECQYCHVPPPPVDPFENPLTVGRVDIRDLDPLVTGVGVGLPDDGLTVQERLALRKAASDAPVATVQQPAQKPPKKKKPQKKAETASEEATPPLPVTQPAEPMLPAAETRPLVEPADDISGAEDEDLQSILEQLGDDDS